MRLPRFRPWLIGAVAVLAVLAVGGPFVYTHFIESKAPPRFSLSSGSSSSTSSSTAVGAPSGTPVGLDGSWNIAAGSQAGYRVNEVLFGQSHEAVGRTGKVSGALTIQGSTVKVSTFTVDLTAVTSDQDRRDRQFQGRIMNTASFPNATFVASAPIDLGAVPAVGVDKAVDVPGQLTLHGASRAVAAHLTVRYTGSSIDVSGSIPVTFADWNIPNPSFAGVVTTEDHGLVEFLLHFSHA